MQDKPDAAELLEAVRDFIRDDLASELSGRKSFLARVAVNVLDIVSRELRSAAHLNTKELDALRRLLGRSGSLDELNREFCRRIRAGEIQPDDPALLEHLWSVARAKLSIDQPKYSTYQAELKQERGS